MTLQKRLLSSIEAFFKTLEVHAESANAPEQASEPELFDDDEEDLDDERREEALAEFVKLGSTSLASSLEPKRLLSQMLELARKNRSAPDAKMFALLHWIQNHQCKGARLEPGKKSRDEKNWTPTRVILFTEYGDTRRYVLNVLNQAIDGTDLCDQRILSLHGGMSEEARAEVQQAFNDPDHPVRILVATDAAREGVNLQGQCADLFHLDIPWNPARMEQRNGRIDRTLQPSPAVRCYYFYYTQRVEDQVLHSLVTKVERIQQELGSIGTVVLGRLSTVLEEGIGSETLAKIDAAEQVGTAARANASEELEQIRFWAEPELPGIQSSPEKSPEERAKERGRQKLKQEITEAGRIFNRSRKVLRFDANLLKDALDVGLEMAGAGPLTSTKAKDGQDSIAAFLLPDLPRSWESTVDTVRPVRKRDELLHEWRKRPPLPVVLDPPKRLEANVAHLHLQHPLVKRVLSKFLAQGFSSHDLNRVTVVRNPGDSLARVIAFGRLSLFGQGATRLHDEVVAVAAQWLDDKGPGHLEPGADEDDTKIVERLEEILSKGVALEAVSDQVRTMLAKGASQDFASLWPHVQSEARAREHTVLGKLSSRGRDEALALQKILSDQRAAIQRTLDDSDQLSLRFTEVEVSQRKQYDEDRVYMQKRMASIELELATEPAALEALYKVELKRISPVGLVYLWPETR